MELAEWMRFYPSVTPDVYWNLAPAEYLTLREYKRRWEKAEREARQKARSRTMRRR